jgi:uncharacterized protein DUF2846
MRGIIVAVLVLASPVLAPNIFAQDDAVKARMAAGCGSNDVMFDVKTDKKQHPTGQPEAGKALVYLFSDEDLDNAAVRIGGLTTRFGIDGSWVGATNYRSYFFVQVDPGDHRVCTSWQSIIKDRTDVSAALSFTAEPGKTYYFRTKTPVHPEPKESVKLVPIDPAEAQLLIAASPFSTFRLKK